MNSSIKLSNDIDDVLAIMPLDGQHKRLLKSSIEQIAYCYARRELESSFERTMKIIRGDKTYQSASEEMQAHEHEETARSEK